jgi:glycosyltransferase involved in cell wall biosynthesis
VPTAVDLDRFKFSPVMPPKLKGLYSGTYNQYYDLELSRRFIEAIKRITDCEVDWAKPKESHANSLSAGEGSIFSVTQPEMANLMSEYSFGISICKEDAGVSLKAAMPTKIAEFLAIGRPVVVNSGLGDCDEIFKDRGAGVIISRKDNLQSKAEELVSIIQEKDSPLLCRSIAEEYFDFDAGVNKYLQIYNLMRD